MKKFFILGILCLSLIFVLGCIGQDEPEDVVSDYFNSITRIRPDFKKAYNLLSSNVQEDLGYVEFYKEMSINSARYGYEYNFELLECEIIEETKDFSIVKITYSLESRVYRVVLSIEETNVSLVKENNNWKIDELFDPF